MTSTSHAGAEAPDARTHRPHRVVIIGSGFGGLFAAKALRRAPVEITLVSSTAHHLFQPLLYQVATGILSQGEIAPPTRDILRRQENLNVVLGEVTEIDVQTRTVTSVIGPQSTQWSYDSLIVAAGAGQSYFGHPEFEEFAPGLKSIDDALELRGRIFGAFEVAEITEPAERDPWTTFVVVGAGATGVEVAGQVSELSRRALKKNFRDIDPSRARVVLLDAGDAVLAAFGPEQSAYAKSTLEKMGVEVRLGTMVTGMDASGVEVRHKDGSTDRIQSRCKIWAAGVQASPLARLLGEATGAEVDRSGRVAVQPDLTLPGHPEVRVIGDMAALDDLPGVAQVAIQQAKYSAKSIKAECAGESLTEPFHYFDKGSMATISRFRAVANVGRLRLHGFIAFLMWLFIHILYLVGFFQRVSTLGHWFVAFIGRSRTERTFTSYQSMGARELRDVPASEIGITNVGLDGAAAAPVAKSAIPTPHPTRPGAETGPGAEGAPGSS